MAEIKRVNPTQPRTFHQLGIFLLDGSGSMSEKSSAKGNVIKALEVDSAMSELFGRMKVSRVDQNFSFAVVKFDHVSTILVEPQRFSSDVFMKQNYNTRDGLESDTRTGGTAIYNALNKAEEMANNFLSQEDTVPQSVLIMVMSDGECSDSNQTIKIAERLKTNPLIKIASVYFANVGEVNKGAQEIMKEIASDSTMYTTVYDGETLRNFFEKSISKTSGVKIDVTENK
jgi:Mg-chelatase subunit ChlD